MAAAERGHTELALAQKYVVQQMQEARVQAMALIEESRKQAAFMLEEAQKQITLLKEQNLIDCQREWARTRLIVQSELKSEYHALLRAGSEKILGRILSEADQTMLMALDPNAEDPELQKDSA